MRAGTQLGQCAQGRLEREEHDRGRLHRRATLELVDAFYRRLALWVARQAVDRVGGNDGNPIRGKASFHPRALLHRAAQELPPTPTRSIPARSRSVRTPEKPAARIDSPTSWA